MEVKNCHMLITSLLNEGAVIKITEHNTSGTGSHIKFTIKVQYISANCAPILLLLILQ
jgi:hypothetical protein